jgi:hypothetical protein
VVLTSLSNLVLSYILGILSGLLLFKPIFFTFTVHPHKQFSFCVSLLNFGGYTGSLFRFLGVEKWQIFFQSRYLIIRYSSVRVCFACVAQAVCAVCACVRVCVCVCCVHLCVKFVCKARQFACWGKELELEVGATPFPRQGRWLTIIVIVNCLLSGSRVLSLLYQIYCGKFRLG